MLFINKFLVSELIEDFIVNFRKIFSLKYLLFNNFLIWDNIAGTQRETHISHPSINNLLKAIYELLSTFRATLNPDMMNYVLCVCGRANMLSLKGS